MKSFVRVMLVALLTTSFAAVACGEWIYVSHRSSDTGDPGKLSRYDGNGTLDQAYSTSIVMPEGVALSPGNGTVVVAEQLTHKLYPFDTGTGTAGTVYTGLPLQRTSAVVFDSSGNIYCGVYDRTTTSQLSYIAKIDAITGNITEWGRVADTYSRIDDLEIYDGKLYASGTGTNSSGVYYWDLATGGNSPTWVAGTSGARCDGLAIDPTDGTIYTCAYVGDYAVVKWNADGTSTQLHQFGTTNSGATDIEYYNGYVYTSGYKNQEVGKIKVSDGSNVYSVAVDLSDDSCNYTRYIEIADIPEPGTFALLATGLIGLLCYAWRKRK